MKPHPVVALDIGGSKVACAIGRPAPLGQVMDILGLGLAEHAAPGQAWPCEPALLARTIEQALEQAGAPEALDRAWVTLSHPDCAHHRVTVDLNLADEPILVRARDVSRLNAHAVSNGLPLDRELLALYAAGYSGSGFDGVRQPHGLSTTRLRGAFHLVSIPPAVRQAVVNAVQAVGLQPERVGYSLEAAASACLDDSHRWPRCLVLDVGAFSTQVGAVSHGVLEQAWTIPWGGMTLAAELARRASVTMAQALSQSLEGFSSSLPLVCETLAEQTEPLNRQLQAIAASGVKPDMAVVTGRGALIDGMVEWIGNGLQLKAILGRSPLAKAQPELSNQVALTPAIGTLLRRLPPAGSPGRVPTGVVDQVIDRTRRILVDYF